MTTPSYVEKELNDTPPINSEKGSSFDWEHDFAGWENGKLFSLPEPKYRDYNEMIRTDGKASAIEQMLSYPIISAPWDIEATKDDDGQREFILDVMTDLPHQGGPRTSVEQLISQMTMSFTHKRVFFEKVFKINDDDKVVYDKLAWRPHETCQLILDDRTGDVRGFRHTPFIQGGRPFISKNGDGYIDFPMEQAFIYTHGTWRDPLMGFSSMDVPYWCYITKRKLRWLWYQFLDQGFLPKTIVKANDENLAISTARKVAQLRGKGVLGVSDDVEITTLESKMQVSTGYLEAIRFLDSEMSGSIMAGFMDLTSAAGEGKGSYALAENQTKLFLRTRRMVARDMARQITNCVIGDLIRYNFGQKAPVPRFQFGALSEQNEAMVLDMFGKIATTGAKVDPEFYDELQARTAQLLELDSGKVKKSMDDAAESPGQLNQIAQQVDVATSMVGTAQAQGKIPPSPVGPPPGNDMPTGPSKTSSPKPTHGKSSVANGPYGGKKKGQNGTR